MENSEKESMIKLMLQNNSSSDETIKRIIEISERYNPLSFNDFITGQTIYSTTVAGERYLIVNQSIEGIQIFKYNIEKIDLRTISYDRLLKYFRFQDDSICGHLKEK